VGHFSLFVDKEVLSIGFPSAFLVFISCFGDDRLLKVCSTHVISRNDSYGKAKAMLSPFNVRIQRSVLNNSASVHL